MEVTTACLAPDVVPDRPGDTRVKEERKCAKRTLMFPGRPQIEMELLDKTWMRVFQYVAVDFDANTKKNRYPIQETLS